MASSMLELEVQDVLESIVELGYVSVKNGVIIELVPPKNNLWHNRWDRWTATINYIREYAKRHHRWSGEYFVCVYDGWREMSAFVDESSRKYVPWSDLDRTKFTGVGLANEPRFCHRHEDPSIYPELPRKVLAYNRHLNDRNVLLIPDGEFIITRFASHVQQVKNGDIPWEQKASKVIWRGSSLVMGNVAFYDLERGSKGQRDAAVSFSAKLECRDVLDASYNPAPILWMLKHKYLLDIDGTVNAWSGLYWKMSSNSLVWKLKSHWEQWYYNLLIPYQHYVPLNDLYQTRELFDWCEQNQSKCFEIVTKAKRLIQKLKYEFAVLEYAIH
jgi:Glycosyl transferase family 90